MFFFFFAADVTQITCLVTVTCWSYSYMHRDSLTSHFPNGRQMLMDSLVPHSAPSAQKQYCRWLFSASLLPTK